ncbi:glycoside hydrolase family 26 protein [Frankia sp. QA3]|uniref:glycoside hydrolase family 26 protein n=1 Tax=Frankia sp. QA3 TaxID=710111 RepID=UPI001E33A659|nr:glycosyl hydrolase [Frankia sp. QA3]
MGGRINPALAVFEQTGSIEDDSRQISYVNVWTTCGGCAPPTDNSSYRYSVAAGSTVGIRFIGAQIDIYGIRSPQGGIITVSIDGQAPYAVNTFAPLPNKALLYRSSVLSDGPHTAFVVNVGRSAGGSTGTWVGFDKADTFREVTPTAPPTTPPTGPNRSGLPWLSGVNGDPIMVPANVDGFCADRGSPCDLSHVFVSRNSWQNMVAPSWTQQNFAGWPGRLVISVPPFPENIGASLETCATGAYDTYWRQFGNTLNSTRRQNSIIRIAWEGNGDWYQWSGRNPTAYVNCWRKVADAIRSTANPDPLLDWSINAHYSQNPPSHNPLDLYPGDQWVDLIGIDAYDHYPPSRTLGEFNKQANETGGITWLYNFARQHGKLFGVGEWGVVSGRDDDGAGDNPSYIQFMWDWMRERAGKGFYYENYYNTCEPPNVGSNLYRPLDTEHCLFKNNQSAARYSALW